MADEAELIIYTDGASRGNPGEAGIGVSILDGSGEVVREFGTFLGVRTNNAAEYAALLAALRAAQELGARAIRIRCDSELMVRQVRGEYRVRNEKLRPLFVEARRLLLRFPRWEIQHVRREENRRADALANLAIDRKGRV